ncbi:hypothetical protein [Botrimarina hoheduenensis]|uniref:Tetratricopeptide repeat protein n=1 Tax=Botrimarina hoheduenensis TaxID=2528000 RepID=A0A5C5W9Y4_9BACT|nr:hypothetical protein [Botrimarina hoheduenensis]TWT46841.1 hypothetical protein Pla111_19430 [Botrimarina hoheduenensis]
MPIFEPNPSPPARQPARRAALRLAAVSACLAVFVASLATAITLVIVRPGAPTTRSAEDPLPTTFSVAPTSPRLAMYGPALGSAAPDDDYAMMARERELHAAIRATRQAQGARPAPPLTSVNEWVEPLVIDNPAAFGPPADDSVPLPPSVKKHRPAPYNVAAAQPASDPSENQSLDARLANHAGRGPSIDRANDAIEPSYVYEESADSLDDTSSFGESAFGAEPVLSAADRASFTDSVADLSQRLTPMVRSGFALGRAGAMYAARNRFIGVLRRIASAKDSQQGSTNHSEALAAGLRALDEADDFAPTGDALEAELDVRSIALSHGTAVVREAAGETAAHEAVALYCREAVDRLAEAAAGEPAGSMALYGLGKTYARIDAQSDDPHAARKCLVMHQAAIAARPENHLAANELGVRLAMAGRYDQASVALRRAAGQQGAAATVYENLAQVERRLGRTAQATSIAAAGQRIAQTEIRHGAVSRRHGVEWVRPEAFNNGAGSAGDTLPATASARTTPSPVAQAPVAQAPAKESPGAWQQAVNFVKTKSGWSPAPAAPVAAPAAHPVAAQYTPVLR